jgi:cystathionine beta-synthase
MVHYEETGREIYE